MATVDIECFQDEYYMILNRVAGQGIKRSPRGQPTRDLGYATVILHDLTQPVLPLNTGRQIGKTVAALEALQIIGGVSTPDLLVRASPGFTNYMERDLVTGEPSYFHGAYGERIGVQMFYAVDKLMNDNDTRQAVITLWDPTKDNLGGKRDYPCTVAMALSIVDDRLRLNVLMRSNDAWLGLPNDVFVFTQLQWTIAHALGIEPDVYIHTAWSLHLYERNLGDIDRVGPASARKYQPTGLMCDTYNAAQHTATALLNGSTFGALLDDDEESRNDDDWLKWYVEAVAPVMG